MSARFQVPEVASALHIHAFDVWTRLADFMQVEPSMPGAVRQHMLFLEERIVGEYGWAVGSPMLLTTAVSTSDLMAGS